MVRDGLQWAGGGKATPVTVERVCLLCVLGTNSSSTHHRYLSVHSYVHPYRQLSLHTFMYPSIFLPSPQTHLSVCPSTRLSMPPPSIHLSTLPSLHTCAPPYLPVYPHIHAFVHLAVLTTHLLFIDTTHHAYCGLQGPASCSNCFPSLHSCHDIMAPQTCPRPFAPTEHVSCTPDSLCISFTRPLVKPYPHRDFLLASVCPSGPHPLMSSLLL